MWPFNRKTNNQTSEIPSGRSGYWMLYLYFDEEKAKQAHQGKNIFEICYQELYRTVPVSELINALLFAGDCMSDLRKFVIGVGMQDLKRLKTIQQHMGKSVSFIGICAYPPMRLAAEGPTHLSETIFCDGKLSMDYYLSSRDVIKAYVEPLKDGTGWAKRVWDDFSKEATTTMKSI